MTILRNHSLKGSDHFEWQKYFADMRDLMTSF